MKTLLSLIFFVFVFSSSDSLDDETIILDELLPILPNSDMFAPGIDLLTLEQQNHVFHVSYSKSQNTSDLKYRIPDGIDSNKLFHCKIIISH